MNLGTMVQDLKIDLDEVDGNLDRIRHKIAQAIDHHRSKRFWFLHKRFSLALEEGRAAYSLSETQPEIASIIGDQAWLLVNANTESRYPVRRISYRHLEDLLSGSSQAKSYPSVFALHAEELAVYPLPSATDHVLTGWGRALAESPRPEWNPTSSAWELPDDSFTNVWFETPGGYQVIREYAAWLLFSGPKADKDRAKDAKERYAAIHRDLELETEEMHLSGVMEPA